jgi:hypothetical protein
MYKSSQKAAACHSKALNIPSSSAVDQQQQQQQHRSNQSRVLQVYKDASNNF